MAVSTRIDPIGRDIELLISRDLSPKARSEFLAQFAREELGKAQRQNEAALGRLPQHETFVDARPGAALESVRPDGTIVFEFELVEQALAAIGEMLVLHSPRLTGRYQDSHVLLADDVAVTPGQPVPQASEYVFVNTQPYARKIEGGLSPQAPDGVYEAVAALAARRFGNTARIRFTFRSLLSAPHKPGATRSEIAQAERDSRQPAIVVGLR
jgi:hypothetical protein